MPDKSRSRTKLIVFFGMTAAGKSYLADIYARKICCAHHNTDVVRKELAGVAVDSRQKTGLSQGIYSEDFTRRTYAELTCRALSDFASSKNKRVVLDGSYGSEAERQRVVETFSTMADIYFIYCYCGEQLIKQRLEKRASDRDAVSDGRWEIYLMQKETFQLPASIEGARLLLLDTAHSVDLLIDEITGFINQPCYETDEQQCLVNEKSQSYTGEE